ncbi:MAG: transketolase [Eubacteriales bacterium]|nr:transketolase [Eubacteriales bacterium]
MQMTDHEMINAIRILSIDAVDAANSGHPGLPLGAAPLVYTLYTKVMRHSPSVPNWFDRDRFVLSAGHGSAMLYSTLHLLGYDFSIDDLKSFRQFNSICHGHPEYSLAHGIEMTTGPLGQGMATAVGLALAERHLAARFNREDFNIIDHHTYALCGDGCMMEGVSGEAASLAGTLGLGKLICLYDSNQITIDGDTDISFREDVGRRYEAYGWQVLEVADANDIEAVEAAIATAKADETHPSLIICRSKIGYGSPLEGSPKSHGAPLGEAKNDETRAKLGWPYKERFMLPTEIVEAYQEVVRKLNPLANTWNQLFVRYQEAYPQEASELMILLNHEQVDYLNDPEFLHFDDCSMATREASFEVLNRMAERDPYFVGGSADLAASNKTDLMGKGFMSSADYSGRNIHFGIREHAMAAIANGLALHALHPFCATFLVFSDYARGAMRLSALMEMPVIYVMTHDSIGVGEDGPTHEPIEHLANLRALPDLDVFRPADARETAYAYALASSRRRPAVMALTRSATGVITKSGPGTERGVYILCENVEASEIPELILMASGSELKPALDAYEKLAKKYKLRLLSCPCLEIFDEQDAAYRESVLPFVCRKRVAVEAGSAQSWYKYVGLDGACVCIDEFGASAPASLLFKHYGFTAEHIAEVCEEVLGK